MGRGNFGLGDRVLGMGFGFVWVWACQSLRYNFMGKSPSTTVVGVVGVVCSCCVCG